MIVIIGALIVVGSVIGGFVMAGGHPAALIHVSEFVVIGGAAIGAAIGIRGNAQADVAAGVAGADSPAAPAASAVPAPGSRTPPSDLCDFTSTGTYPSP